MGQGISPEDCDSGPRGCRGRGHPVRPGRREGQRRKGPAQQRGQAQAVRMPGLRTEARRPGHRPSQGRARPPAWTSMTQQRAEPQAQVHLDFPVKWVLSSSPSRRGNSQPFLEDTSTIQGLHVDNKLPQADPKPGGFGEATLGTICHDGSKLSLSYDPPQSRIPRTPQTAKKACARLQAGTSSPPSFHSL